MQPDQFRPLRTRSSDRAMAAYSCINFRFVSFPHVELDQRKLATAAAQR